jgi:4-hydroxy-tetrahydrodipicolinate synthase
MDLSLHAQDCGADYIVVHAPVLSFVHDRGEVLYQYYKALCDRLDIGIAMWSHPDSGYLMQPEECARIAELPNIVAIKYSVPREMYVKLSHMIGDKIQVSTSAEDDWLDNIEELGWQLYLCSSPPYHLQTRNDKRMDEYTRLAFAGNFSEARRVRDSLDPVREAMLQSKPADKPQAFGKYWQELLGQVGGHVRPPMLELTDAEKATIRDAFETCGLKL